MATTTFGFTTSLRHLTHLPFTKPSHFSTLLASAAARLPDSSTKFHPSLEVLGGAADTFLPAFKSPHLPYVPYPLIASNRHVETIFAAFYRSLPDVRFHRECLRTSDDGAVAIDWVSGDDRNLPSESPVLILLPGLTGGSGDTYVRHMLSRARSKGWRVLVFNSRGCGNSPVTTAQFYSASFLGDISEVVEHVGSRYPRAKLYAVGWSLGANILVRYVGQMKTFVKALTSFMTKLWQIRSAEFSGGMHFYLRIYEANLISHWLQMLNPLENLMRD